jgi:hypothetical protein
VSADVISNPLPEAGIRAFLDGLLVSQPNKTAYQETYAVVEGYTFVSFQLGTQPIVTGTRVSGISSVRNRRIVVYVRPSRAHCAQVSY